MWLNSFPCRCISGKTVSLIAMLSCLLCACTVGPDFIRPATQRLSDYRTNPEPPTTGDVGVQLFNTQAKLPSEWWRLFHSERLSAQVQEAIDHNPSLEAAMATLRQSQHNLQAGYGVFFPQFDVGLNALRERNSPLQQGQHSDSTVFNVVTLNGSVGYTLDLFGGERRAIEGLAAQLDYQRYVTKAAYVTLSANVVDANIAHAGYTAQISAVDQLIALQREQLRIAQTQRKAGIAAYSAELAARSALAATETLLPPLKKQLEQTESLLATLQGKFPSELPPNGEVLNELVLPLDLPLSLPSELVQQRPDILQSEAQLHMASANIGVATASMFPRISLTGTVGLAGTSLGNLPGANGRFWSVGPSLSIPLFKGGSLWYEREAAIDAFHAAQANYRSTVLSAFAQVADTLQALDQDQKTLQAQYDSQHAASETLNITQTNFQTGVASYQDVLSADVQFHLANIGYIQAQTQRYQDTVALFVALGGGWWNTLEQVR